MVEQIIRYYGSCASGTHPCKYVQWLPRRHIEHDQVHGKNDQCCPQILGNHQNQHVNSSNYSRNHDIFKTGIHLQARSRKEYENDFHKPRRL